MHARRHPDAAFDAGLSKVGLDGYRPLPGTFPVKCLAIVRLVRAGATYAEVLAAAIVASLRVDPPPGSPARVVIRWFEGPDYLTVHALGPTRRPTCPPPTRGIRSGGPASRARSRGSTRSSKTRRSRPRPSRSRPNRRTGPGHRRRSPNHWSGPRHTSDGSWRTLGRSLRSLRRRRVPLRRVGARQRSAHQSRIGLELLRQQEFAPEE